MTGGEDDDTSANAADDRTGGLCFRTCGLFFSTRRGFYGGSMQRSAMEIGGAHSSKLTGILDMFSVSIHLIPKP